MLKCQKRYQRRILYPQVMSQKWNEFVVPGRMFKYPLLRQWPWNPWFGGHHYVEMSKTLSETNPLPSGHVADVKWVCCTRQNAQVPTFEVVTLKSLVWRSPLCWNVENVIRDESSTLSSCHRSEMSLLYQAECSSTHFWGSDLEILGLEVTTMLKCRKRYQRQILYHQVMSQKWNEFVVPGRMFKFPLLR